MDTLYTFGDHITHHKTESVHFFGLVNSATKNPTITEKVNLFWARVLSPGSPPKWAGTRRGSSGLRFHNGFRF